MKTIDVLVVRIYMTEGSHLLDKVIQYLKKEAQIRGVTVFRAISGFGNTGSQHSASLIDLSLNLPLVVEFFDDDRQRIETALNHLESQVKSEHIIMWEAKANA